jgi:hypothetical protein
VQFQGDPVHLLEGLFLQASQEPVVLRSCSQES